MPAAERTPSTGTRDRIAGWAVYGSLFVMAVAIGGSLYEHLVVDPAWPNQITLIQPSAGGVSRTRFWIPVHAALTLLLPVTLWACWQSRAARRWIVAALLAYVAARLWSAVYFIPRALWFERVGELTGPALEEARTWVRWSPVRTLLLAFATAALAIAARLRRLRADTTVEIRRTDPRPIGWHSRAST